MDRRTGLSEREGAEARAGTMDRSERDSVKARLFGGEDSQHLLKQVIKSRLLRSLQPPTGGLETCLESDVATQPQGGDLPVGPVRIGRFAVLRKIGQGGMGVVYLAYDEELDRRVAIKLLRSELSSDERGRARMFREAKALARLPHPNVVQVHEVGRWRDHDYVAMEFVAGETLGKWSRERGRSWEQVLDVLLQAGRGLAAAHAVDLVHRDFKPANVLVGEDGRVRVLDFGLARTTAEVGEAGTPAAGVEGLETLEQSVLPLSSSSEAAKPVRSTGAFAAVLTVTGAVMGTPAYMAPEQHLGQSATALSDQFAFCVCLYECLYGERPFTGRTHAEYAEQVTAGRIQPAPNGASVPLWLRRVVLRGLAVDPSDRWPSMDALLAELSRDRARRWRIGAVALGLVAVLVAALIAEGREAPMCAVDADSYSAVWGPERRAAVSEAFAASGQAGATQALATAEETLDAYRDELVVARQAVCQERWIRRVESEDVLRLREACLDQRARELGVVVDTLAEADAATVRRVGALMDGLGEIAMCDRTDLLEAGMPAPRDAVMAHEVAALREEIARAHAMRRVGNMDGADRLSEELVAWAERLDYGPTLAEIRMLQGFNAKRARRNDEAKKLFEDALESSVRNDLKRLTAEIWVQLAYFAAYQGKGPSDERVYRIASAEVERAGGGPRLQSYLHGARGMGFRASGKFDEALNEYSRGIEQAESGFPGDERRLMSLFGVRGGVLEELGRAEEAREDYERVLAIARKTGNTQSRYALDSAYDLGLLELNARDLQSAEEHLQLAIEGYEVTYGSHHEDIVEADLALAKLYLMQGKADQAHVRAKRAVDAFGVDDLDYDWALDALAETQLAIGDTRAAEASIRTALIHRVKVSPDELDRIAYLHVRLGDALLAQERNDDALVEYEAAIGLYAKTDLAESPDAGRAFHGQAVAYRENDQLDLALTSIQRAVSLVPIDSGDVFLSAEVHLCYLQLQASLDQRSSDFSIRLDEVSQLLENVDGVEDLKSQVEKLAHL